MLHSKEKIFIEYVIKTLGVQYVTEFQFAKPRKFRFDYAIPELKIAIEYEGIRSSKSRHTTITGYTNDTTKYNLAAVNGWAVLRYTALNYANVENDLKLLYLQPIHTRTAK